MRRLAVCLILISTAFAQKKPITLESLGRGVRGSGGPFLWMPDGKTFLLREGRSLVIYDPATRSSKTLIDLGANPVDAVQDPLP